MMRGLNISFPRCQIVSNANMKMFGHLNLLQNSKFLVAFLFGLVFLCYVTTTGHLIYKLYRGKKVMFEMQ